jgi:hypothetical protein
MYPHVIRLRGPWEVEPVAPPAGPSSKLIETQSVPAQPTTRMTMPGGWNEGPLGVFAGCVRCRRRFGYPGRIDDHERVWLTFAGVTGKAAASLNGRLLGRRDETGPALEYDVTDILKDRNELALEVDVPPGCSRLWDEVALEVRCTAFLRAVRAKATAAEGLLALDVSGEVVGTAERPLELYVLLDGATVHYAMVNPTPEGRPFHVTIADLRGDQRQPPVETHAGSHVVRVDLVNGAVVWYAVERLVALDADGAPNP